jgi:hypothetical protein
MNATSPLATAQQHLAINALASLIAQQLFNVGAHQKAARVTIGQKPRDTFGVQSTTTGSTLRIRRMGSRKKHDRRRVRGIPGRAPAQRERRLVQKKEKEMRLVLLRLRALERSGDGSIAAVEERDECFRDVRRLAITPKGLVSEEFRKELWPFLLGGGSATRAERKGPANTERDSAVAHRDATQVEKDVERSLWHYDVLQGLKESERRTKRRALTKLILGVLDANDELFYFQGYHDIVSVFLLTMGNSSSTMQAVQRVSETYQREPMRQGFEQVMATTRLLFPLLDAADELLFQHLHASGVRRWPERRGG